MSYKSKSIAKIVDEIEHSKMYLPALQRKFVWGKCVSSPKNSTEIK